MELRAIFLILGSVQLVGSSLTGEIAGQTNSGNEIITQCFCLTPEHVTYPCKCQGKRNSKPPTLIEKKEFIEYIAMTNSRAGIFRASEEETTFGQRDQDKEIIQDHQETSELVT